jgi:hypothetical protein
VVTEIMELELAVQPGIKYLGEPTHHKQAKRFTSVE